MGWAMCPLTLEISQHLPPLALLQATQISRPWGKVKLDQGRWGPGNIASHVT